MKALYIGVCVAFLAVFFSACSGKKKPICNFQSVECHTICNANECTQQCVSASGDYYKK